MIWDLWPGHSRRLAQEQQSDSLADVGLLPLSNKAEDPPLMDTEAPLFVCAPGGELCLI